jgi:hypothetical protein
MREENTAMKWLRKLGSLPGRLLAKLGWQRRDELKSAHWKRASALYRWQQHNKTTRR